MRADLARLLMDGAGLLAERVDRMAARATPARDGESTSRGDGTTVKRIGSMASLASFLGQAGGKKRDGGNRS